MSGYIGVVPLPQATQTRDVFTASAGQTSFATSGYTPGFVDVYLNGVKLVDSVDFTANNGSDVVLAAGAATSDIVEVLSYSTYEVNNQAFTGDFSVDGTTFKVDSTNNRVGIGTSSPAEKLEVYGTNPAVSIMSDSTSGRSDLFFKDADGAAGRLRYDHASNYLAVFTNGNESMRIDSGGNVLCGSDGGGDIGSSTKRFKDLYLSGGVYLGGTGAANYLDDYEEGTFTPTLTYATPGTLSITLATQSGRYTKIGNVCHYTVDIRLTSFVKGTASGDLIVGNFPFSSANYGNFNRANAVPSLYQWPYQTNAGYHPFFVMRSDGQPLGELSMSVSNGVNVAISDPDGDSMLFLTGWYYTA